MTPDPWQDVERALAEGPDATRRLRQRARVLDGLQAQRRRRRLVPALVAVTVVAAVGAVIWWPSAPVRDADGAAVPLGAVLVASSSRELRFSEGSRVVLLPATRARIDAADGSRVEVVVESGRVEAEVTKGTGRTWRYRAGPWVVRVVGTRLSVGWSPADEAVEVEVTEGAVEVTGPGLASPVLVRAGEALRRQVARAEPAPAVKAPPVAAAQPEPEPFAAMELDQARPTPSPAPKAPRRLAAERAAEATGWRELLAAGKRREALDAAASSGELARLDRLSDGDALALADAARLERRADLSRQLLGQVLARDGAEAAEAAFLLGRLEVDARKPGAAVTYFRRAVQLAPDGAFAEQSRGRLMEALLELPDAEAARAVAIDYLAHHPAGAWAGLATRLSGGGAK